MKILNEQEHPQLQTLNEMIVNVHSSLPKETEQSIYYAKLKQLLHGEIYDFCKEQIEMKQDLNFFRMNVGNVMEESEIREYLDGLKDKYNTHYDNIGLEYHIEVTRYDFGVPVICVIKRGQIHMKKFVFRFRKKSASTSLDGISNAGVPIKGGKE